MMENPPKEQELARKNYRDNEPEIVAGAFGFIISAIIALGAMGAFLLWKSLSG